MRDPMLERCREGSAHAVGVALAPAADQRAGERLVAEVALSGDGGCHNGRQVQAIEVSDGTGVTAGEQRGTLWPR
jgi:hypothetical protein